MLDFARPSASGRPASAAPSVLRHRLVRTFALAALAAALSLPAFSGPARADALAGWNYRRNVTIDNSARATPLVRYAAHVTLQSPGFDFSQARADGGDIRFADVNGNLLPYWVETWNPAGGKASLWVRVDSIPAASVGTVQLAYGNPSAGSAADGHATFLFFDGFETKNAAGPLVTPTYEGSGQAMHPDIVRIPGGWNGYQYWMAVTPYPYDQDGLENPSIIASNDGLTWVVPAGLTNPIAAPFSGGYNNDNDLLYVNNKLVCYYNETKTAGTTALRRLESTDGVHWTGPTTTLTVNNYIMSPAIVIENGVWKMWYVTSTAGCTAAAQTVVLRTSADGLSWSAAQTVSFTGANTIPWHLDVVKDGGTYKMLVACYAPGSTCEHTDLYYAESTDGLAWTYAPRPIISRTAAAWDNFEIYRSTFLVENGLMRIWYSASSTAHVWGTAYVQGTLQDFLDATATPWDYTQGNLTNATSPVRHGAYSLQEVGGSSTYPQAFKNQTGKFAVTSWFYDDLSNVAEHAASLRLWDAGNAQYPLHAVGVGLMSDISKTNYVAMTEGWNYAVTGLARTAGWHQLTAAVADATCRLFVDGTLVASYPVLNEAAITQFSIEGDVAGTSWFDDVYARSYVEPEPPVTVLAAGGNTAPVAAIATPAPNAFYVTGQNIALSGSASDGQDPAGAIALHWSVDLHQGATVTPGWFQADGATAAFTAQQADLGNGAYYTVNLTATDTGGLTNTASLNLWPEIDLVPSAVAVTPAAPLATDSVTYAFTIQNAGRMPAPASRWRLRADNQLLGEGDVAVPASGATAIQFKTGPNLLAGNHALRLVADTLAAIRETSEGNNAVTANLVITAVANRPPVVNATGTPTSGYAPLAVAFTAGASDPDGDALTYAWAFGDGGTATSANPSRTYSTTGVFNAVVTVSDGRGGSTKDTVVVTVAAKPAFPATAVLDDFNRANGAVGGSWTGDVNGFVITSSQATQNCCYVSAVWNGAVHGTNQEAYFTFNTIATKAADQDLMLKVQGTTYTAGHIEVRYAAANKRVTVMTYDPAVGWVTRGTNISVTFAAGDRFGARAYANGNVDVYRNGTLLGTRSVGTWAFAALGGRIGMTLQGANNARLDNFGGGSLTPAGAAAAVAAGADEDAARPEPVPGLPSGLALSSAFPNPAQGDVALWLDLPRATTVGFEVLDVQGRHVWSEPAQVREAGRWRMGWDGRTAAGARAREGLYMARVTVDGRTLARRFVLLQ